MRTNTPARRNEWLDLFDLMAPTDMLRNFRGDMIRVEEFTDGDQFVVRAELPGIDPDKDVEVTAVDGHLTIKAHREERMERTDDDAYRSEFRYGSFIRSIPLPRDVDFDQIKATYRHGVLEVRMPHTEEGMQPKSIRVESE